MLFLALTLISLWLPWPAIASVPDRPAIAQAAIPTPTQALERLFQAETIQSEWFAPVFLQQVPFPQMQATLDGLTAQLGALQGIEPLAEGYQLRFENGTLSALIQLNDAGQIVALLFSPLAEAVSLAEAIAAIEAFPGEASLLVLAGDEAVAAVAAETPLAVGSAFKLAVLAALQRAIAAGTLRWDTVVPLEAAWRSLPSGLLQDWPVGSAVTLETLATLMISVSDNTSTDALIHVLGREAVEAVTPRNQPFLTTRDFFVLKNPENADALAAFRQGSDRDRRRLLTTLPDLPLPPASLFNGDPIALDVEWFLSARELCDLMATVKDLPLMGVNPGVARPEDWRHIAFKGGSEPGVLNLTTWLEAEDGQAYCVVATWNDPSQALDEMALIQTYQGLVTGLAERSQP